jgi:transglutaminase-like putative cysteine protease
VSCLVCRDFSGPDAHAARFPRESIPSHDIHWIARELTAPFTGPTDKARAIFTWLHHNIAYDARAFFGNNVQGSTPASTMASGLAVCEGYAVLFNAMALAAGVESIVVTGHGKGLYMPHSMLAIIIMLIPKYRNWVF